MMKKTRGPKSRWTVPLSRRILAGKWAYLSVLPEVLLIAIWAYGPTVPVRVARGPAGSQLPQSLLQFPVTEIDGLTKQSKTSSILLLENLLKISKP